MAATGFLQQPPPMGPRTSSPAITWKKWRQRFEIYMTAAGKTEANDDVKTSLLLHAIGQEGIEIFNTFTFTEEEESINVGEVSSAFCAESQPYVRKTSFFYSEQASRGVNRQVCDRPPHSFGNMCVWHLR